MHVPVMTPHQEHMTYTHEGQTEKMSRVGQESHLLLLAKRG